MRIRSEVIGCGDHLCPAYCYVKFSLCDLLVFSADSLFFFSSRRRHTRCSRDWSSDVCSSDLAAYDPEYANRHWRILVQADDVLKRFRASFLGKCSPVHFFWGSFDLAVTRFSGRRAPERPGADQVTREAYSHEVISAGFWAGSRDVREAAFYAYAAPEPAGLRDLVPKPSAVYYHAPMGIFILPYEAVRTAGSPADALLAFLQSTYDAAADLAHWDRDALERPAHPSPARGRSEERRVGKECRSRWSPYH